MNPVDTKLRQTTPSETPRVLGFDAVGVVQAVGDEVTLFNEGDEIYYSGSPNYQGSNQTYQLVDERLAAHKPKIYPITKRLVYL